jgi:uncharacterized ferritin-like protein (DUF455 family)
MPLPMNFYDLAETCLYTPAIDAKLAATDRAADILAGPGFVFDPAAPPRPATEAQFPERPAWVEPRELPRRGLHTEAGRVAFLHAIAHIEFTAIQLAFDMAYRFREFPDEFRLDWLKVAIEEASHFRALEGRLKDFGARYGDCPVHGGLWELAEDTAHDALHRLALVPRFMEARGLDVTPAMIGKLKTLGDSASADILGLILREEIGHVALGTRWFRQACERRGLDAEEEYFALVNRYIRGAVRGPFNKEARRAAGFSEGELARLDRLGE